MGWRIERDMVKAMYESLIRNESGDTFCRIWKAKIPYKIKIFLWLVENNTILIPKDNMLKRNWLRDSSCQFCTEIESCDHLFFRCPSARCVWGIVATGIGAGDMSSRHLAVNNSGVGCRSTFLKGKVFTYFA
jgi:hypothetical protein